MKLVDREKSPKSGRGLSDRERLSGSTGDPGQGQALAGVTGARMIGQSQLSLLPMCMCVCVCACVPVHTWATWWMPANGRTLLGRHRLGRELPHPASLGALVGMIPMDIGHDERGVSEDDVPWAGAGTCLVEGQCHRLPGEGLRL